MAADNSPILLKPIAITVVVALVFLVALKPILDTYYTEMFEGEEYRKVGSLQPAELNALHAAEAKGFASAPIKLDKAMAMVARDRAIAAISPEQSTDTASLVGWAQLPKDGLGSLPPVPSAAPSSSAAPASSAPAPVPAGSGSAVPAPAGSAPAPGPPAPAPAPSGAPAPSRAPAPHT